MKAVVLTVGEGTIIRSGSYIMRRVRVGANCGIGPNVCIFPFDQYQPSLDHRSLWRD